MHCGYFDTTWKGNRSSFLTPTMVGEWCPFRLKFALNDPPHFEKRRLRQISAYNVSTVRDSERSSLTTNRKLTRAFQRAINGVRTLPLSPVRRVAQKAILGFLGKIQFQSNKVCYKVSLCENFQRQKPFPIQGGDWKRGSGKCDTVKIARVENAGVENAGVDTRQQGWKMQE